MQDTLKRAALELAVDTPEGFAGTLRTEYQRWGRIVKALDFSMD